MMSSKIMASPPPWTSYPSLPLRSASYAYGAFGASYPPNYLSPPHYMEPVPRGQYQYAYVPPYAQSFRRRPRRRRVVGP